MITKSTIIATLCAIAFFSLPAFAQKTGKKPTQTITARTPSVQPEPRFCLHMTVNENGDSEITVQKEDGSRTLTSGDSALLLGDLSRVWGAIGPKGSVMPGLIIKAAPSLKYGKLIDAINSARNSSKMPIKLEAENGPFIGVPTKPDPNRAPRPNPLYLHVVVKDAEISINSVPMGKFPATGQLEERLKGVFKDRIANGVFREGTNTVDTTVFIKVSESATAADLFMLAKAVRAAGSDDVQLGIDELVHMVELQETPRN